MVEKKHILVVDDTPSNIKILIDILKADYKLSAAKHSKRVYKKPFSNTKAVEIIKEVSNIHFDPNLGEVFLKLENKFKQIAVLYVDSQEELDALKALEK